MELFHVQRFYGDDDEFGFQRNPEKEKERLEELRKKIEKKKTKNLVAKSYSDKCETPRSRIEVKTKEHDDSAKTVVERTKKSTIKKRIKEHVDSEVGLQGFLYEKESGIEGVHVLEEGSPRKKRKKKSIEHDSHREKPSKGLGKREPVEADGNDCFANREEQENISNADLSLDAEKLHKDSSLVMDNNKVDIETDHIDSIDNFNANGEPSDIEKSENYYPILGSLKKKKDKPSVKRMLPKWIAQPKEIFSQKTNEQVSVKECSYLKEFSKKNLELLRINHLFPVQSNVIPYILSQNCKDSIFGKAGLQPSDICVSAPTGSGKTLAYAVPIVQVIHHCLFRRLQALVVLPSKDLASQVKTVFSKLVAGTHLKIGLASGVKSFHDEQQLLVSAGQHGFVSNVDILVSTPGRLVDHITSTDGFSLQHIRFLVIDEADRLLGQSYHNWLEKIFEAIFTASTFDSSNKSTLVEGRCGRGYLVASSIDRNELPLQKLLFSATMTQNPEKLGPLNLYNPVFFKVMGKAESEDKDTSKGSEETERYTLPELLEEKMTICKPGEKPLLVVYFVKVLNYRRILCFTGSIEATHRLFLLLKAFDIKASEFSSNLNQTQRKGTLRDFKMGKIDLLVCSDAMSRGMDIEDVDFVISYDPPVNMKTYIHRVGRTARAGNRGTALTLLSSKEVFHFKKMAMDSSRKSSVQKLVVPKNELEPLMPDYQNALASLKDLVKTEHQQKS